LKQRLKRLKTAEMKLMTRTAGYNFNYEQEF